MTTTLPANFTSTIHRVIAGLGVDGKVVDQLCAEVGELLNEAVNDAVREHVDEGASALRSQRLGLTENQAAMRWCPMVREVIDEAHAVGNRYQDISGDSCANPVGSRCIGSMCLSWRWDSERRGHCGLAGPITYQPLGEPRRIPDRTPLPRPHESLAQDLELIVDNDE